MLTIARIVQTCAGMPSQWEGFMTDGSAFYVRYRHGYLNMHGAPTDPLAMDATAIIDNERIGDDGYLTFDELREHLTRHSINSPERMEAETTWHRGIVPALMSGPPTQQQANLSRIPVVTLRRLRSRTVGDMTTFGPDYEDD